MLAHGKGSCRRLRLRGVYHRTANAAGGQDPWVATLKLKRHLNVVGGWPLSAGLRHFSPCRCLMKTPGLPCRACLSLLYAIHACTATPAYAGTCLFFRPLLAARILSILPASSNP